VIVGQLQEDFSESLRLTGALYFGCARVSSANDCCYLMLARDSVVAACNLMNILFLLVCAL
jgi:hypothetical protein